MMTRKFKQKARANLDFYRAIKGLRSYSYERSPLWKNRRFEAENGILLDWGPGRGRMGETRRLIMDY